MTDICHSCREGRHDQHVPEFHLNRRAFPKDFLRSCKCPDCDSWWVINKNGALLVRRRSTVVRGEALVSGPYATIASAKAAWAEILDRKEAK